MRQDEDGTDDVQIGKRIRLGLRRRRWYLRAIRKRRELRTVRLRGTKIALASNVVISVIRNEKVRLPYFLRYYRDLGIEHFLFIDNGSEDGSLAYLSEQPDCSVWSTDASYRRARFGLDWVNWLARRYCVGRWVLHVDADEFFVFPFCDTRPIRALTDWLDGSDIRSFGTMLIDMYPKGPVADAAYEAGQNPFEVAAWFDSGNYTITRNWECKSLWIQGGPRARVFFRGDPWRAPALNKVPLVKWRRGTVFASSTHNVLPRGLNLVFDDLGGEMACGVLLHAKFLNILADRAKDKSVRAEHYADGHEHQAYAEGLESAPELWSNWSERYINWRQLEILGLMSKGNWA